MPKGVQNANPVRLERLRAKVAQSLAFSLNSNKSYNLLSNIIFEQTGAMLSNSTLRRVFQYDSENHPTKSTLDLICKCIGFHDWDDYIEKERNHSQNDLSQVISILKLQGIKDHALTKQIIKTYSDNPDFFILMDTVVQVAIKSHDVPFLKELFDLPGVFDRERDPTDIFYFTHSLVMDLNQSGLMPKLINAYGKSPLAHVYIVECYVDEDNLNGYYYDLLQVYQQYKKTPQSLLFYNCLMYQRAIEHSLPKNPWADFVLNFDETILIHHIPGGRRLAILLLEANGKEEIITATLKKTRDLFHNLNEEQKINAALYMVKLLFHSRNNELIHEILSYAQDINSRNKHIWDRININQIKIYRAYSLFIKKDKTNALHKLNEFNPVFVDAFIHNHIMHDFQVISDLISNE